MIARSFTQISALLSVAGLVSIGTVAPAAVALPLAEDKAAKQESQDTTVRQGVPGRRIGGGTRSDSIFVNGSESLSVLDAPNPLTITTAAYPEMTFHIPEMKTDNRAEFVLLNAAGEVVYEEVFVAQRESAVISVETADIEGASPIRFDRNYEWYFSIIPDADDRANDVVVHGSIRRVDESD